MCALNVEPLLREDVVADADDVVPDAADERGCKSVVVALLKSK